MCSHSGVRDNIGWGPGTCAVCGAGAGTRLPARLDHWSVVPSPDLELALNIPQTLARATALAGTRLLCGHR